MKNPDTSTTRKAASKRILSSGIPLEMAVYDLLANGLDADWIEPTYEFTSIDDSGSVLQRSVDFVASIPSSRDPLDASSVQLYVLVEAKYCNPKETIWLFMPDACPKQGGAFHESRPSLWQDKEPHEGSSTAQSTDEFQRCVRGEVLGAVYESEDGKKGAANRDKKRMPSLATALHQLRDALHHLATERFRLFTKMWQQPACTSFIPIVITNAELRVLKPGIHETLLTPATEHNVDLDAISTVAARLLVRCPSDLRQVDWKWQRFQKDHSGYDLSRVEEGLPAYKRERTLEAHLRHFFSDTPGYVTVATIEEARTVIQECVSWAKELVFE